ncbi:MAG: hypothetical protein HC808_01225 [Candidatus Competibacteraceae bacterium]|nr:hypothetical protein [Candidatus Competibacteraceae bacterium]
MQTQVLVNPSYAGRGHRAEDYLRQQIAFYEARLDEMGEKGDCAYEHALSRAYQVLLRERKQQLADL